MNCMKKNYFLLSFIVVLFISTQTTKAQFTSDFEDLTLSSESFWNGSSGSGNFTSGQVKYLNVYTTSYGSWSGFSYSNITNNTTVGYANQYSAITGKGAENSKNYAVGYGSDTLVFTKPANVDGLYVTNSTYAYYEMLNGSNFSKKFGTNDWFKLTIKGFDSNKTLVREVDYYLADFRFTDTSKNFILNTWQWVDLNSFTNVSYITFGRTSSDNGQWGMNTPDYFCLDGLKVKGYTSIPSTNYSKFKIFTNSSSSKISISGDDEISSVRIYNLSGSLLFDNNYNERSVNISLPNVLKGIFIVKVNSGNYEDVRKIIF